MCRGEGNFDRAIEGIRCLQRNHVELSVRLTINKHNVNDLASAAELLLEDLGLPAFSCNSAMEMGLCRNAPEDIQLDIDGTSVAMDTLIRLVAKYKGRITSNAGPLSLGPKFVEMEEARKRNLDSDKTGGYLLSCGGPRGQMAVRSDGVMTPCGLLAHIELGRINHDSLMDVWQNHPELDRIRCRNLIPLSKFEFCSGCDYIDYCLGGCPGTAYVLTGSDEHPSPDSCMKRFMDGGGRLPEIIKQIGRDTMTG